MLNLTAPQHEDTLNFLSAEEAFSLIERDLDLIGADREFVCMSANVPNVRQYQSEVNGFPVTLTMEAHSLTDCSLRIIASHGEAYTELCDIPRLQYVDVVPRACEALNTLDNISSIKQQTHETFERGPVATD